MKSKSVTIQIKVTPDRGRCPPGKIHKRTTLKENTANYISFERVSSANFRKKHELPVSPTPQKKIAINREDDHVSFN